MARHLKADGTAYLWFSLLDLPWLDVWRQSLERCGLPQRQVIDWPVSMSADSLDWEIFPVSEVILVVSRQDRYQARSARLNGRRSASVREPSQVYRKPLRLVEQLLARRDASVLLDPFVQSGVTLRAAQSVGLAEATGCLLDASFAPEIRATLGSGTIPI